MKLGSCPAVKRNLSRSSCSWQPTKVCIFLMNPSNFIDSNKKCKILDMISQLQKNNKLVIIVSHDPDFLKEENKTLKLVRMD